jgi:tRNA A37 threonylcarbamoyladenosine modification protein TsaB
MENEELKAYLAEHPDYLLCGNASHLGLEGVQNDLLSNLASSADQAHKVEDVLAAKPVYLKDSYATV